MILAEGESGEQETHAGDLPGQPAGCSICPSFLHWGRGRKHDSTGSSQGFYLENDWFMFQGKMEARYS